MERRGSLGQGVHWIPVALRAGLTSLVVSGVAQAQPSGVDDDAADPSSDSPTTDGVTETNEPAAPPEEGADDAQSPGGPDETPTSEAEPAATQSSTAPPSDAAPPEAEAKPAAAATTPAATSVEEDSVKAEAEALQPTGGPYGDRNIGIALTTGYVATGGDVFGLIVEPHGFNLGIAASYTWDIGLWLGIEGRYFFGNEVEQVYLPPLTTLEIPMTMKSSLASIALTGGFEHLVGPVVFRYGLELGVSIISWDMGDLPFLFVAGYPSLVGTLASPHLAPGVGVVLPIDWFYVGIDFRYRLELGSQVPSGAGGHLATGVRF